MVYIYTILLSLACLLITLSPVLGQNEESSDPDKPHIKVKVNKEYDENGNVTRIDSVYTYYFSDTFTDNESDTLAINEYHHQDGHHPPMFALPDPLIPDFDFDFDFDLPCDTSMYFNQDIEKFFDDADIERNFRHHMPDSEEFMRQQHETMKHLEEVLKEQQEMIRQYMEQNKEHIEMEMKKLKESQKDLEQMKKEEEKNLPEPDKI